MMQRTMIMMSAAGLLALSVMAAGAESQDASAEKLEMAQAPEAAERAADFVRESRRMRRGGMHGQMHRQMPELLTPNAAQRLRGIALQSVFVMLDADGDGALSLEEVQAFTERMFNLLDTDDDGQLTIEEVATFVSGHPAQE